MVVGALIHCALVHSVCDLKATHMKMRHSLIQELMLYKFKLSHNTRDAIKNICCVKGEGVAEYSTITRKFKEFYLYCKNLDNQARSDRPKTVDSNAMLQAIEESSTWRVSGELIA